MRPLRLLLADDHAIVRDGLRRILETQPGWTVAAQAGDGRGAVEQFLAHRPDVAILDIAMPVLNGIEACRQIVERVPSARALMLSMHADRSYVAQATRAGARGYLLKDAADQELIRAVGAVAAGKPFRSPGIERLTIDDEWRGQAAAAHDPYETLTAREREILRWIAEGHTGWLIARQLSISPATVETHRLRLMDKLDLHSVAELVRFAVRRGVVS